MCTQLISRHCSAHLALANRPLHMIQEGCDVGILPGKITDESVIARPAGLITLHLAATPGLVKSRPVVKKLADLKSWPWVSLSGSQFWGTKEIKLMEQNGNEEVLPISPVLVSEGVTSTREAVRAGLGVAILPDWLIEEDLRSGRLVRVLPKLNTKGLPNLPHVRLVNSGLCALKYTLAIATLRHGCSVD